MLARRHDATLKSGRNNALVAESRIGDERVVLAFPLTYMNDSGQAVRSLVRRYRIDEPGQVVVVHDELDLPPAAVRVKVGGGLAGHNGLRSVASHLGTTTSSASASASASRRRRSAAPTTCSTAPGTPARAVRRRRAGGRRRRRADRRRGSRCSDAPLQRACRSRRWLTLMPEGDTIRRLAERINQRFAGQRCHALRHP